MALLHVGFFSDELGMSVNMDVILPQKSYKLIGMDTEDSSDKYPTVYLLHGWSDDHTIWQRRTSIERYASDLGVAVVMPAVGLSFYCDMVHGPKYWKFISEELPVICRRFFPNMSDKREDTFVAGLSMGGYGALKLALSKPDLFSKAASFSGVVDLPMFREKTRDQDFWHWDNVFHDDDKISGTDNDIYTLAEKLKSSGKEFPELYMWCGTEDEYVYDCNLSIKKKFTQLGVPFTYEEGPGTHDWARWDEQIDYILKKFLGK